MPNMTFWLSMKNARSKSKSLALKAAAAAVPQAPSQPQVRHFPTDSQTRRKDVAQRQRSQTQGYCPSSLTYSCSEPTGSLEEDMGIGRDWICSWLDQRQMSCWHCRYHLFPAVSCLSLISSPEPQSQLFQQIVLEKLCGSVRKHKISR